MPRSAVPGDVGPVGGSCSEAPRLSIAVSLWKRAGCQWRWWGRLSLKRRDRELAAELTAETFAAAIVGARGFRDEGQPADGVVRTTPVAAFALPYPADVGQPTAVGGGQPSEHGSPLSDRQCGLVPGRPPTLGGPTPPSSQSVDTQRALGAGDLREREHLLAPGVTLAKTSPTALAGSLAMSQGRSASRSTLIGRVSIDRTTEPAAAGRCGTVAAPERRRPLIRRLATRKPGDRRV
jgi:hypothetical protein